MQALHACSGLAAEMGLDVEALRTAAATMLCFAPQYVDTLAAALATTLDGARINPFTVFCTTWYPALAQLPRADFAAAWNLTYYLMLDARVTGAVEYVAAQCALRNIVLPPASSGAGLQPLSAQQCVRRDRVVARIERETATAWDTVDDVRRGLGNLQTIKELIIAALWGHADAVKAYVDAHIKPFNLSETPRAAARGGHTALLEWLYTHGYARVDGEVYAFAAAAGGHVDTLQWLCSPPLCIRLTETTCEAAARGGHLLALQWCREHGAPWDERTCAAAARAGHLDVLQWAHAAGCPLPTWHNFPECYYLHHAEDAQIIAWLAAKRKETL